MTLSAVLAYRYAGRLGDDSVAPGSFGRIAVARRRTTPSAGVGSPSDDR